MYVYSVQCAAAFGQKACLHCIKNDGTLLRITVFEQSVKKNPKKVVVRGHANLKASFVPKFLDGS